MLEVTEAARERLKALLDANTENPEDGIRLTIDEREQLGITVDQEKPGDQVIEHEGSKVLFLDPLFFLELVQVILQCGQSECHT